MKTPGVRTSDCYRSQRLQHWLLLMLAGLILSGCHIRVQYPGEIISNYTVTRTHHMWAWGLVGAYSDEIYTHCTDGKMYELHIYSSMAQGLFTVLSLGFYTPRTIKITCSGKAEPPKQFDAIPESADGTPDGKVKKPKLPPRNQAPRRFEHR